MAAQQKVKAQLSVSRMIFIIVSWQTL